jgi:hypothetical protein
VMADDEGTGQAEDQKATPRLTARPPGGHTTPHEGENNWDGWPILDLRPARDPEPLIEPGEYDAAAVGARVHPSIGGRYKFFLTLEIIGGEADGVRVEFICALPNKGGRGVSPSSKYYRAWVTANGGRPRRKDRMSPSVFKNRLFQIRVRTVVTDHQGRPLAAAHQYSVVDELLGPGPLPTPVPSPVPAPVPPPTPSPAPPPSPPNPKKSARLRTELQNTLGKIRLEGRA